MHSSKKYINYCSQPHNSSEARKDIYEQIYCYSASLLLKPLSEHKCDWFLSIIFGYIILGQQRAAQGDTYNESIEIGQGSSFLPTEDSLPYSQVDGRSAQTETL